MANSKAKSTDNLLPGKPKRNEANEKALKKASPKLTGGRYILKDGKLQTVSSIVDTEPQTLSEEEAE